MKCCDPGVVPKLILKMLTGAYYGHYQLTNEMVTQGTKVFSYLLTHKGENSYTDMLGKIYIFKFSNLRNI